MHGVQMAEEEDTRQDYTLAPMNTLVGTTAQRHYWCLMSCKGRGVRVADLASASRR